MNELVNYCVLGSLPGIEIRELLWGELKEKGSGHMTIQAAQSLEENFTVSWLPLDSVCFREVLRHQNWLSPHISIPGMRNHGSSWQHLCVCFELYCT